MNKLLKYFLLTLPFGIFFSCSTEPEKHVEYHLLRVNKVEHADSAALNDTIKIIVSGYAGPEGCSSFSRIESIYTPSSLDIKVWGKEVLGAVCPAVVIAFRKELRAVAQRRGKYTIRIAQPDGSVMRDSVSVI